MFFPFVSTARFDDMLREKNYQIADRDRRIAQLEAERRMLLDKLCLLATKGLKLSPEEKPLLSDESASPPAEPGPPARAAVARDGMRAVLDGNESATPAIGSETRGYDNGRSHLSLSPQDAQNRRVLGTPKNPSEATGRHSPRAEALGSRRPSQIMRQMDRLAEARWLRKVYPAKAAELQREEVMNQLDAAHKEAVEKAVVST